MGVVKTFELDVDQTRVRVLRPCRVIVVESLGGDPEGGCE